MKQFTYTIQDSMGIHARPAGLLVKAAAAFKDTTIEISSNGKKADVKRIMAIMSMGVKQGAEVTVTCEGADEDAAAEAMEKFFKENNHPNFPARSCVEVARLPKDVKIEIEAIAVRR